MEVSAINFPGGVGLHGRTPLLRLQSDERLVALVRRGSAAAFEALVARYEHRLLSFCRHLLGSREDAEDVLQEVMAAAFHALIADERPINVRPWLYRIARNRCLNLLRRSRPPGVGLIDLQFSDFGATAADKVDEREDFRTLVQDIQRLPETQRTALVLREMEALSYEQIAETMETTVSGIKSLLVRARVSLAEAAEARQITCEEVREELGEIAEGLRRRSTPPVRRHLAGCQRCAAFKTQLRQTNRALAALLPLGPLVVLRRFVLSQLGHHAGSGAAGAGSTAAGSTAAGTTAAGSTFAGGSLVAGSSPGLISAGLGAIATKAAVGLAAAALVTAAGVEVDHLGNGPPQTNYRSAGLPGEGSSAGQPAGAMAVHDGPAAASLAHHGSFSSAAAHSSNPSSASTSRGAATTTGKPGTTASTASTITPEATGTPVALTTPTASATTPASVPATTTTEPSGVTQTETIPTVLSQGGVSGSTGGGSATATGTTTSTGTQPPSGSGASGSGTTGSGTSGSGTTTSGSGTTGPPPPPPALQPPPPPPWQFPPPPEPQPPPPPPQ